MEETIGLNKTNKIKITNIKEMGCVNGLKKINTPSPSIRDLRKFSSIIPPKMAPITAGMIGYPYLFMTKPMKPNMPIANRSTKMNQIVKIPSDAMMITKGIIKFLLTMVIYPMYLAVSSAKTIITISESSKAIKIVKVMMRPFPSNSE